jgi:Uma2 family endonuclease
MHQALTTLSMMGVPKPIKCYTPQEYYDLERTATYKSDFYAGEIFAMAGGSRRHSRICANLSREVGNRLKGTPCAEYESNLRLKIAATGLRTYPDVSVYCGALEKDEDDHDGETFTNPTVLFEVLSPSTEGYDRGLKSESYRFIASLKAYVLVSQDTAHAEIYERQADGSWVLREVRGMESVLAIPPIGVELPLKEVYDRVDFAAEEPAAEPPHASGSTTA